MTYPIKSKMITSKVEFYEEVREMNEEATQYLLSFTWCKSIASSDLYYNLGSKLCIFLFEIENSSSPEDSFLWVIVGDIPPMYLDTLGSRTTREVLKDYVRLAEDWINHVKAGMSVEECYPIQAAPVVEMAELLEKRTNFIKNNVIENMDEIAL